MGALLLLVAAALWGSAFVAQKLCGEHLGPFAVTFLRNLIGGAFIYACFRLRLRFFGRAGIPAGARRSFSGRAFLGGGLCGAVLFAASLSQQIGIGHTSPGVSAFLTSNYMLLIPVFGFFIGRAVRAAVWLCVAMAVAGSYLICIESGAAGFSLGRGEAWTLLCAALFAVQVLCVDRFAPSTDVLAFSCVQQFAGAVLALPFVFLPSERALFTSSNLLAAAWPVVYIAVFSSGIAFTLQNFGQVRTPPAIAAVIMSLESAIGAACGYIVFGDVLSARQIVGCALMLLAVVLSQILPARQKRKSPRPPSQEYGKIQACMKGNDNG